MELLLLRRVMDAARIELAIRGSKNTGFNQLTIRALTWFTSAACLGRPAKTLPQTGRFSVTALVAGGENPSYASGS